MNVWDRIFRRSAAASYQGGAVLDHLPLVQSDDWRRLRLLQAAEKYGKPFKCAGADVPYEHLKLEPKRISAAQPISAVHQNSDGGRSGIRRRPFRSTRWR